ncbi:MAG: hypothetical protein K0R02_601 [Rickettsiaceae bacterium]|jgi:thiaminase|nr:hypothetical protein [Rickettsiaceae bacterium]
MWDKEIQGLKNNSFKMIELCFERPNKLDLQILAEALENNISLEVFKFRCLYINDDLICVLNALKNHPSLKHFQLHNQSLTVETNQALSLMIKTTPNLEFLELHNIRFHDEDVLMLSDAFEGKTSLKTINIELLNPNLASATIDKFITNISKLNLEKLQIYGNKNYYFVKAFSQVLSNMKNLQDLSIHKCITDEGMLFLAESLKFNTSLTKLDIGHNLIEENGIKALADMFKTNNTIKEIKLRCNPGADYIDKYFIPALEYNFTLNSIEAFTCNKDYVDLLKRNKTLEPVLKAVNQAKDWFVERQSSLAPITKPCLKALELLKEHKGKILAYPKILSYIKDGNINLIEPNELYKELEIYKSCNYLTLITVCKNYQKSAADSFGLLPNELLVTIFKNTLPMDEKVEPYVEPEPSSEMTGVFFGYGFYPELI